MSTRLNGSRAVCGALVVALGWWAAPARSQLRAEIRLRYIPGSPSIHLVSIPHAAAIDDVANGGNRDVCDISVSGGDGLVDIDDVLCTLWGGGVQSERLGLMSVAQFIPEECSFRVRTGRPNPLAPGGNIFLGEPWVPDWTRGFQVQLGPDPSGVPHDATVELEAPCEPGFQGMTLSGRWTCTPGRNFSLLALPYDSAYRHAVEIFCGQEGVDWVDADENHVPDTCAGGLFDGRTPLVLWVFDNDPDTLPEGDGRWHAVSVRPGCFIGGALWPYGWGGPMFDLEPGDAVLLQHSTEYDPTFWNPPDDGVTCPD